jgi:hypothetical protein
MGNFDQAKQYADLNKDGRVDASDFNITKTYERKVQAFASKFHKRY